MTTAEKLELLITKFQNSNFEPVIYSVAVWGKGSWERKTAYFKTEAQAKHFLKSESRMEVSIEPNPQYPGYGLNKIQLTYLEWKHDRIEFKNFKSAKNYVIENIKSLWDGYNLVWSDLNKNDIYPEPEF